METTARQTPILRLSLLAATARSLGGGLLVANASIGETAEALRGVDGKYGAPSGETAPRLKGSQERADLFKENRITVEYDSTGKVWRVAYQKKNMDDERIESLLEMNSGTVKWSKPLKFRGNRHWVTEDGKLHAVYYGTPIFKLVVMTDKATKAERLAQGLAARETKEATGGAENSGTGEKTTEPKKNDPLEGF